MPSPTPPAAQPGSSPIRTAGYAAGPSGAGTHATHAVTPALEAALASPGDHAALERLLALVHTLPEAERDATRASLARQLGWMTPAVARLCLRSSSLLSGLSRNTALPSEAVAYLANAAVDLLEQRPASRRLDAGPELVDPDAERESSAPESAADLDGSEHLRSDYLQERLGRWWGTGTSRWPLRFESAPVARMCAAVERVLEGGDSGGTHAGREGGGPAAGPAAGSPADRLVPPWWSLFYGYLGFRRPRNADGDAMSAWLDRVAPLIARAMQESGDALLRMLPVREADPGRAELALPLLLAKDRRYVARRLAQAVLECPWTTLASCDVVTAAVGQHEALAARSEDDRYWRHLVAGTAMKHPEARRDPVVVTRVAPWLWVQDAHDALHAEIIEWHSARDSAAGSTAAPLCPTAPPTSVPAHYEGGPLSRAISTWPLADCRRWVLGLLKNRDLVEQRWDALLTVLAEGPRILLASLQPEDLLPFLGHPEAEVRALVSELLAWVGVPPDAPPPAPARPLVRR